MVGYDLLLGGLVVGTSAQTSYAFSGLSCNTAYTLGVDAYDAAGNRSTVSSLIVTTSACADTSPPSAPTNLAESASTSSSITAGWTASSDNVGVTGYRVFVDGSQAGTTATTSYTRQLGFRVAARTRSSLTPMTLPATAPRRPRRRWPRSSCPAPPPGDTTPPSTPTGLGVSSAGQTSLALSWNASSDNVGVTGYGVYKNGTLAASPTATSYTLTGLSAAAPPTRSPSMPSTRPATAPPRPRSRPAPPPAPTPRRRPYRAVSRLPRVRRRASRSPGRRRRDNVGVAGYDLYRAGSAVGTATTTAYTFTGLTCNTNYTLAVDAYDAAGNKSAQATTAIATSACPDTTPPSTPTGLATSAVGQTSLTLSWTASSDNVGVTGYRMFQNGTQVGTSTATSYPFSGLAAGRVTRWASRPSMPRGTSPVPRRSGRARPPARAAAAGLGHGERVCGAERVGQRHELQALFDGHAFPSDRTTVCRTINKAYGLATCADHILVGGGTYSSGAAESLTTPARTHARPLPESTSMSSPARR